MRQASAATAGALVWKLPQDPKVNSEGTTISSIVKRLLHCAHRYLSHAIRLAMEVCFLLSLFLLYPSGRTEATRLRAGSTTITAAAMVQQQQRLASDTQHPNDSATPEQIHIALASVKPRETYAVSVSWVTWVDSKSQVFWGREANALTEAVTGNSTSERCIFLFILVNWPALFLEAVEYSGLLGLV